MSIKTLLITLITANLVFANIDELRNAKLSPFSSNTEAITLPHMADTCKSYTYDLTNESWNLLSTEVKSRKDDTLIYTTKEQLLIYALNSDNLVTYATTKKWHEESDSWINIGKSHFYTASYNDANKLAKYTFRSSKPGPANGVTREFTFTYNDQNALTGITRDYDYYAPRNASKSNLTKEFSKLLSLDTESVTLIWDGTSMSYSQMNGQSNFQNQTVLIIYFDGAKNISRIEETVSSVCDKTPEDTNVTFNTYVYSYDNRRLVREEFLTRREKESDDSLVQFYEYSFDGDFVTEQKEKDCSYRYRYEDGRMVEMIKKEGASYDVPVEKKEYIYNPTALLSNSAKGNSMNISAISVTKENLNFTVHSKATDLLSAELYTLQGKSLVKQKEIKPGSVNMILPKHISSGVYVLSVFNGSMSSPVTITVP